MSYPVECKFSIRFDSGLYSCGCGHKEGAPSWCTEPDDCEEFEKQS